MMQLYEEKFRICQLVSNVKYSGRKPPPPGGGKNKLFPKASKNKAKISSQYMQKLVKCTQFLTFLVIFHEI